MSDAMPKHVFLNVQEITEGYLDGMPNSVSAISEFAKRNNWQEAGEDFARKRSRRGGGWEYNPAVFPAAARADFLRKYYEQLAREARANGAEFFNGLEAKLAERAAFSEALAEWSCPAFVPLLFSSKQPFVQKLTGFSNLMQNVFS
ncbi:MAG: hypothetical protein COB24_12930, partial [Hyphomicrobiales bacterium]